MTIKPVLSALVMGALIVGCAAPNTLSPQGSSEEVLREQRKQRELALKQWLKEDKQVNEVSYPILKANAPLCAETDHKLGVFYWNKYSVPERYGDVAEIHYGLGDMVQIQDVYKGTPAAKAGLKTGDAIIAVNGEPVPSGKKGVQETTKLLEKVEGSSITLTINRAGKEMDVNVKREETCDYNMVYNPDDSSVNAFADGKNIIISRGLLRFTENNNELALVVSHELAHNSMLHIDKKQSNATMAGAGGLLVDILFAAAGVNTQGTFTDAASKMGAQSYSVEFEQEADYVGMYYLARTGYDTSGVANFWRRMSAENNDASIDIRNTHPTAPERFIAIEKTHKEIMNKKASKKDLKPEIKVEKASYEAETGKEEFNN